MAVFGIELAANWMHEWQCRVFVFPGRIDMWWPLVSMVRANFGVAGKI